MNKDANVIAYLHSIYTSHILCTCSPRIFSARFIIILKMPPGVGTIKENEKYDVCLSLSYVRFNKVAG